MKGADVVLERFLVSKPRFWLPKTLPKPSQNLSKNDVPENMQFFINFCSNFDACCKSQHQKNVRPRSVLLAFHTIQRVARCMHFWFKKPAKNPSKTMSEPIKNRCKKHIVFHHRVFWALASIWEPLGLQVGAKLAVLDSQGPPKSLQNPVFWEHVSKMLPKRFPSGSKRSPKEGPELNFRRFFDRFGNLFSSFFSVKFSPPNLQLSYYVLAE